FFRFEEAADYTALFAAAGRFSLSRHWRSWLLRKCLAARFFFVADSLESRRGPRTFVGDLINEIANVRFFQSPLCRHHSRGIFFIRDSLKTATFAQTFI